MRQSSKVIYDALVATIEKDYVILQKLFDAARDRKLATVLKSLRDSLLKKQELVDELYQCAITDGLTGFKTRGYLESVLKEELKNETSLGYFIIDVDHFKPYNDTFGHQQGDVAIQTTADVIRQNADSDLIARYGGEEFSLFLVRYRGKRMYTKGEEIRAAVENHIVLPFSPERIAKKIMRKVASSGSLDDRVDTRDMPGRIVKFFRTPVTTASYDKRLNAYFGGTLFGQYVRQLQRLTVSVGGAQRIKGETVPELMDRADEALYEAKKTRNKVVIS
jgi:diguanylate cyclase (GGDEF)-like protein